MAISFGALGLAALLVVTVTLLLDAPRSQLPLMAQRWTGFLPLVVPPIIGAGAGVMGLATPGHHKLLSGLGLLLNLGFGLSFAGVLMLAG